jgi:hypothetical protein
VEQGCGGMPDATANRWESSALLTIGHGKRIMVRFPKPIDHRPSLPDADPDSDRPRCGGRESELLLMQCHPEDCSTGINPEEYPNHP